MILLACYLPQLLAGQSRSGSYLRVGGLIGRDVEWRSSDSSPSETVPFDSHFRGSCIEYEYAGRNISFILGGESIIRNYDLSAYYQTNSRYFDHWYNHEYEETSYRYSSITHHLGISPGIQFHPWSTNRFCQFSFGSGICFHWMQKMHVSEDSYYSADVWHHYNQQTYDMTTYYSNVVNSSATEVLEMNHQKWRSSWFMECRVNFRLAVRFFAGLEIGYRFYTAEVFSPTVAFTPDFGRYLRLSMAWKFSDEKEKADAIKPIVTE